MSQRRGEKINGGGREDGKICHKSEKNALLQVSTESGETAVFAKCMHRKGSTRYEELKVLVMFGLFLSMLSSYGHMVRTHFHTQSRAMLDRAAFESLATGR